MNPVEQKEVCLMLNLGGFEKRMNENLKVARRIGKTVYALTGDGLAKIEHDSYMVPVNVMSLTPAELLVWSSMINDQLQEEGFQTEDAIILAAGRQYRGMIPLGTAITGGIRLGA